MSRHAVVQSDVLGYVVSIAARGMLFHHADRFAADLNQRPRSSGTYFRVIPDHSLDDNEAQDE